MSERCIERKKVTEIFIIFFSRSQSLFAFMIFHDEVKRRGNEEKVERTAPFK